MPPIILHRNTSISLSRLVLRSWEFPGTAPADRPAPSSLSLIGIENVHIFINIINTVQQYVNGEIPDVQASFRKGRGTSDQIANICWIIEKTREFQKISIYFIDYAKAFECVDHNKQENS